VGIKYTELGTKSSSSQLWNQFVEKSEKEQEITRKWLTVVEKNMIDSVSERRKIPKEEALALKNKVFHPREALRAKLIDSVSTFEEFAAVNYPNHSVEDVVYRLDGTRLRPTLTQKELSALTTLFEVAQMP
jgi:ClpP class serine protease